MSQTPITIVEYDSRWPRQSEAEADRIREALGTHTLAVEHVGSTAVPGLAAKPILDLLVGVASLADAEACIDPLVGLGYEYCPEFEDAMPRRRYFRKVRDGDHTHHVHLVERDGRFWRRHLDFREYLREHPAVARRYERVKRELAERHRHDAVAYGEGKSGFVEAVERRAKGRYGRW